MPEVIVSGVGGDKRGELIDLDGDHAIVRIDGKRRVVKAKRVRYVSTGDDVSPHTLTRAPSYERPEMRAIRKDGPGRDPAYLAYVRGHACASCYRSGPSEAHHWGPGGGTGMKCDDRRTVPLCARCHRMFHDTGELPMHNAAATRALFLAKQVDLLVRWVARHG